MQALKTIFMALAFVTLAQPVAAIGILRDAGIEHGLRQLAAPILRAAGLSSGSVQILLVDDSSLNAFVVDHQHIFMTTGLLLKLDNAAMFQAVIAHEAAHIANGHLARRAGNARAARNAAGMGVLLAGIAAASGGGKASAGLALGAASSAYRVLLSHSRAEEASADQSSVRYMVQAGVDPQGAVDVHQMFRGQEALSAARQDPYARTHPLSSDRARALSGFVAAYGKSVKPNPTADYWFARAQGKLSAHQRNPKWTLRRSPKSMTADIRAMREAVAWHQRANLKMALPLIDQALKIRPKDAYYWDLKGEILLKSRQPKAAVSAYANAVKLGGNDAIILGGYGRALLASGQIRPALKALETARARDFNNSGILRDLAVAYAKTGNKGMASLVTAERYALQGRLKDAEIHAKRASDLLPRGSGPWQRAQDVLSAAKRVKK